MDLWDTEWDVSRIQLSMQELDEADVDHLQTSMTRHCLSFSFDPDEMVPFDTPVADSVCPSTIPQFAAAVTLPSLEMRPTLSAEEVRVLNFVSSHAYALHRMIYRGDLPLLRRFLAMAPINLPAAINQPDHRGNSPLMLALKLSHESACYYTIARLLLAHGADIKLRDGNGWSPLDEAVVKGDRDMVGLLFDHLYAEKVNKWEAAKSRAAVALKQLPDFYMELKWEFDSAIIPLVSKIAPHDVCRIWKSGNSLRLDMTLVGWKKLRSKRRNLSILFIDRGTGHDLILVNHSKEMVVQPLEPLDPQERDAVITDLLRADTVQGELSLGQCNVTPVSSWSGKPVCGIISGWRCAKLEVQLQADIHYSKRGNKLLLLKEREYFGSYSSPPEVAEQYRNSRRARVLVWITREFPVTLGAFLPVLELLAPGHITVQKLHDFLTSQAFSQHFASDMFPVRLELPLTLTIKAQVTFQAMEVGPIPSCVFGVPEYQRISRKVAQKTLSCPRKRILFVNMAV
jgi:hypothetical protein